MRCVQAPFPARLVIPRAYITEWRAVAPWSQDAWVEQDLVISRALVALFSVAAVAERLAFRGGRSPGFRRDILPLLRPDSGPDFDIDKALDIVRARLIRMLPGEPWQGVRA